MRVTKLIREYVEEQVSNVYDAKENPFSKQAELDKQKLRDFADKLLKQQQSVIDEFLSEIPLYYYWDNSIRSTIKASCPDISGSYRTQAMLSEKEWVKENTRQKNAKVREIILALELGANRQELNDMIAKLLEDTND